MSKKVFIVHGFEGSPNGGWRPWLMAELSKKDIYAGALLMPEPDNPVLEEWIEEISRQVEKCKDDEIYLVGHSLGVTAILRFLEETKMNNVYGSVFVSGVSEKIGNLKIDSFMKNDFDFEKIKSKCKSFSIIHGDNDPYVPLNDAKILSDKLDVQLIIVKNGGHLNGSAGWLTLPCCLEALNKMMK